jgi:hypothetical protein
VRRSGAPLLLILLAAAAGCAPPLPPADPLAPAAAACRAAAEAQGLRVRQAAIRPIPGAGLGGAERIVAAEVTLVTADAVRRCLWTAGAGTAVLAPA